MIIFDYKNIKNLTIKFKQMEYILKEALLEASKWETNLTEYERTKISFDGARKQVIDRVFEKYKNKLNIKTNENRNK